MKLSLRICTLIIAVLFMTSVVSLQSSIPAAAPNIQISDVSVPTELYQAERGQVNATVHNLLNISFDGFARFVDVSGEIRSQSLVDPLSELVNFTIGPEETLTVIVDYKVNETATLGPHTVTFEVNVGEYSFLFAQYQITVLPVASIHAIMPGNVFSQNQAGLLLVAIENHVDRTRSVRLDVFGPKFINASEEVDLAPGLNTVAIPLMPNVSHVYDFGMFTANVSMFYFDEMIDSEVVFVPVDMALLNKLLAVVLPAVIFFVLVLFYALRKRQRVRAAITSE